ncbi:MAG: hypothetical protein KDF54_11910 [Hydrogenophaga sp.]|nr:hypothetical protein [Hydrogenophaga sp.]
MPLEAEPPEDPELDAEEPLRLPPPELELPELELPEFEPLEDEELPPLESPPPPRPLLPEDDELPESPPRRPEFPSLACNAPEASASVMAVARPTRRNLLSVTMVFS